MASLATSNLFHVFALWTSVFIQLHGLFRENEILGAKSPQEPASSEDLYVLCMSVCM